MVCLVPIELLTKLAEYSVVPLHRVARDSDPRVPRSPKRSIKGRGLEDYTLASASYLVCKRKELAGQLNTPWIRWKTFKPGVIMVCRKVQLLVPRMAIVALSGCAPALWQCFWVGTRTDSRSELLLEDRKRWRGSKKRPVFVWRMIEARFQLHS